MIPEKGRLIEMYEAVRLSATRSYFSSPYTFEKKVVSEKGVLAWAIRWDQLSLDAPPRKPLSNTHTEHTNRQVDINDELKNVLMQMALKLVEGGGHGNGISQ
jgi:hypothetical protein